jgi:hypothetical protein
MRGRRESGGARGRALVLGGLAAHDAGVGALAGSGVVEAVARGAALGGNGAGAGVRGTLCDGRAVGVGSGGLGRGVGVGDELRGGQLCVGIGEGVRALPASD